MSRYVTIPKPAEFIDPGNKKTATIENDAGRRVPLPDRDHEWFMHVYILSHLQFDLDVGGAEATRAAKEIARSLAKAIEAGEGFYEVSDDSNKRINCCTARATDEDYEESRKERPSKRMLARSTLGMNPKMDNFTAACFMEHFDALDNASTVKPEVVVATIEVGTSISAAISDE